jgi:succinyl-CoA synthetase beta subunit
MELLEYQAKELFRQMEIPVLPSQRIDQPRDLKQLKIPYPVVLKSQVYTGGRGKAGGIRFVSNTIDAMAAAQSIFHLPIMGNYPSVLLAEAKYEADREFYLSVVLDTSTRRPLLLGSQAGGEAVESKLSDVQQVIVDQEFSPFYARRLAVQMGLKGELILAVSQIVEKMYTLFSQKDLDLVEINPLAVSTSGKLMALDGKVAVNDAALGRHPDLVELSPRFAKPALSARRSINAPPPYSATSHAATGNGHSMNGAPISEPIASALKLVQLDGNIGVICNGAGLAMATLDLIYAAKGKPMGFVDLGGEQHYGRSPEALRDRIKQSLHLLRQRPELKVVLINILSGVMSGISVAEAIADCLKQVSSLPAPAIVVRLMGEEFAAAQTILTELEIPVLESLDAAIAEAITLAKPSKR